MTRLRFVVRSSWKGYENEFEPIDEDSSCIHVVLYAGKELAGCARVFPEELERTLNPGMPQSPACSLDAGVQQGETYIMGRVAVMPTMRRRGLARELVRASERAAREAGARLIKLHAQEYIRDLYAAEGYERGRLRRRRPAPSLDGKAAVELVCTAFAPLWGSTRLSELAFP